MKVSPCFSLTASVAFVSVATISQLATINNAIASYAPPPIGHNLVVHNKCNRPIRLSVLYPHPNTGRMVEEGWYTFRPNTSSVLKSDIYDGNIFIRNESFAYFYAETIDGSGDHWEKARSVHFINQKALRRSDGSRVPYGRVGERGDFRITLGCDA
jgi:hypothetical protein